LGFGRALMCRDLVTKARRRCARSGRHHEPRSLVASRAVGGLRTSMPLYDGRRPAFIPSRRAPAARSGPDSGPRRRGRARRRRALASGAPRPKIGGVALSRGETDSRAPRFTRGTRSSTASAASLQSTEHRGFRRRQRPHPPASSPRCTSARARRSGSRYGRPAKRWTSEHVLPQRRREGARADGPPGRLLLAHCSSEAESASTLLLRSERRTFSDLTCRGCWVTQSDEPCDRRLLRRYSRAFVREPHTDMEHQLPA
jgi:hypothetical protein